MLSFSFENENEDEVSRRARQIKISTNWSDTDQQNTVKKYLEEIMKKGGYEI